MKEKLQKYLAGEREGFSLVELIIVIAIMAILVGVVALAVLPNIEKSKESKDFATLDSVCSALNAAVATTQVSGQGAFELPTSAPSGTSDWEKVATSLLQNLGTGGKTLQSSNTSGAKIICYYDTTNGTIEVVATTESITDGSTTAPAAGSIVETKYGKQKLQVSN